MRKLRLVCIFTILFLSGCALFDNKNAGLNSDGQVGFKIPFDWPQEDLYTTEGIIKRNFSKGEVTEILGAPVSIQSLDEYEKWAYHLREGELSLFFIDGRLNRWQIEEARSIK
jgi:hypothetical protein